MLYDMRCDVCRRELTIGVPISQHKNVIAPGWPCSAAPTKFNCSGRMKQIFKAPSMIISREPFPATGNEVQLPTPHHVDKKFQDKIHARDWLGERGLTSKWIENDM
ncbi:hypothetical protein LCGC14_1737420 [marine sediment metagenome]|uniref:Uncharacterized protein n=1 Tax=marine sediment metagenome TaxID=412755 RepID=A0A0F9H7R0_9ZZZZ